MKLSHIFTILVGSLLISIVYSEIISFSLLGISAGLSAIIGYTYKSYYQNYEPCIKPNITNLYNDLQENVFGQHIVVNELPAAIEAHINSNSVKPLVMSFHGWTGGGKNFVSNFLSKNMYRKGLKSKFRHLFNGRADFPQNDLVENYRMQLHSWIRGNLTDCPYSMFIFDEVEKMPERILDGIKPLIDNVGIANGIDYSKAIYIFLSNIGGDLIMHRYLELWRDEGKRREDMTLNDFHNAINLAVFNIEGGFKQSDIIHHNLVDHYFPFLPLERNHVIQCIKRELEQYIQPFEEVFNNYLQLFEVDIINEVLKTVTFSSEPEHLFSSSGCRRIDQQVRMVVNRIKSDYRRLQKTANRN